MKTIPTRRLPTPPPPPAKKPPAIRYEPGMGITQSILKDFLACRYRAKLSAEGWETKHQRPVFRFGDLFHNTLDALYSSYRKGMKKDWSLSFALNKAEDFTNQNLKKRSPNDNAEEIEFEGGLVEILLPAYVKYWPEDFARKWLAVEGEFDHTLQLANGFKHRLKGKRDGVFLDTPKKGKPAVWLLETKTKSQISEDDLDLTLSFDFQSLFYLLTLEADYKGAEPIAGSLYNVIRKPGLKQREASEKLKRKKAETKNDVLKRVADDVAKRPDHYFKRFEIVFPQDVRVQFRKELELQLNDFQAWYDGHLPTYRNPNSCLTKFKCGFLEHCSSGSFAGYSRTRQPFPELAPVVK